MVKPISDEDLAEFRASFEADGVALCCPSDDDIAGILARLDAAEAERDALRAEVERLRTPDMFWGEDGAPVEDWTDALDGAPPLEVQELDTARHLGPRYAVYIPRDDTRRWRDDCHLFATREEAEAAVAAAAREPAS